MILDQKTSKESNISGKIWYLILIVGQFGTGQFGTRTIWHQTFDMIKLNLKDHFWQNFGQKFSFGVILTRVIACSLKIGETLPFLQLKPKLATIFFFQKCCFFGILLI